MTEALYHGDAYLRGMEATATRAEDDRVVLDRTVFFARSGGQPADHGTLSWEGPDDGEDVRTRVVDVRREGDDLWHKLEGPVPEEGAHVRGELDWERRHALMRAHTALHVLCGVIWRNHEAPVTGADMEPGKGRMDFELEGMSGAFAEEVQAAVDAEINADREVRISFLPREEAYAIPDLIRTRSDRLPEGIEQVRIVDVVGLDLQADGGTHVRKTGEVGRVRVVGHKSKGRANKRLRIAIEDAPTGEGSPVAGEAAGRAGEPR